MSFVFFSCPFLHPVVGDVERRFHYRYFKTCACVYDVDSSGICIKNGVHCPYAHGAADLRAPVFDSRDINNVNEEDPELASKAFSILVQETYFEDPAWDGNINDFYMLIKCLLWTLYTMIEETGSVLNFRRTLAHLNIVSRLSSFCISSTYTGCCL